WVMPTIITAAYEDRRLLILNWVFQGRATLPLEHYLARWSVIDGAIPLAGLLHLAIIRFILSICYQDQVPHLNTTRADSRINFALIVFSATFLGWTILSGAHQDYVAYLEEWMAILRGRDPWSMSSYFNAYGPVFNLLAPLAWVNPLANKLLFAFVYLVFMIWLIKDFRVDRGLVVLSWPMVVFWLLNLFLWVEIGYFGHFDALVAAACVAAVHHRVRGKDAVSGICLALGILLKYLPIVILPFLAFDERRFRFRLSTYCILFVVLGFVLSVLVWGTSTFTPLMFAATREPSSSIYNLLGQPAFSPVRLIWDLPNGNWLPIPFLLTAGLGVFVWAMIWRIEPALSAVLAVLATLLFYQSGYIQYQIILFFLMSYWVVSERERLKNHYFLIGLLVGYFGFITFLDLAYMLGLKIYEIP